MNKETKYFIVGFAHNSGFGNISCYSDEEFFTARQLQVLINTTNPEIKGAAVISINRVTKEEYEYFRSDK